MISKVRLPPKIGSLHRFVAPELIAIADQVLLSAMNVITIWVLASSSTNESFGALALIYGWWLVLVLVARSAIAEVFASEIPSEGEEKAGFSSFLALLLILGGCLLYTSPSPRDRG